MSKKLLTILCVTTFCLALFGCATTNPDGAPSAGRSAAGGAVAGAVLGGILGGLCGLIPGGSIAANLAKGAIIGAASGVVAGAIVGFAYGKQQEQLYRDRLAAEAFHQYKAEQGEKVVVEAVEVKPGDPTQGTSASLDATFSILTGNSEPVPVEVVQVVMSQNKVCGQPLCNKADRVSGTYVISVPLQIPENAPEGKYQLLTQVKTTKASDQKGFDFNVCKKPEPPGKPAPAEKTESTESSPS